MRFAVLLCFSGFWTLASAFVAPSVAVTGKALPAKAASLSPSSKAAAGPGQHRYQRQTGCSCGSQGGSSSCLGMKGFGSIIDGTDKSALFVDPTNPASDAKVKRDLEMITRRHPMKMLDGGAMETMVYDEARIGPPPDLPSLLLHNRIVYCGMPLVAAVTELIVAELLYLNYESTEKPIYMYLNTPGTSTPDGRSVGFETEAFAIADTMKYVRPPIYTICVGQAFGAGAMLLAQGEKGNRSALPNASIMLHQPRSMARGQASDIAIKAKEVVANRKITVSMIAKACGKNVEMVEKDAARTKYMSPQEAVEYGIIDKVLESKKEKVGPTWMDTFKADMDPFLAEKERASTMW